ncbi:carboxylesterase/lipase family protein [soil metagenome]
MTRRFRTGAAALAICAGLLAAACSDDDTPATERVTKFGTVDGLDRSSTTGTYAWLGVPFAQPPVAALRWAPPVDPAPWTGRRAATQFGHSCAQGGRYFSPAPNDAAYGLAVREGFGKPVGDEDCLTLNIWRPADNQTQLPVIFFIHGGSNISGYSADPIYDGQALAKKANAVVVTVNYRVGVLGWLDLPQLKTGDAPTDSGDFALLDQLQALKFVQGNIGAFGGDAGNVTVMGQSAGAVNVWALLVSPLSVGLMHKAVPLSGGIANATRSTAQTYSKALLNAIVIADGKATDTASALAWVATQTNAQIAAYLRGMSANQILRVMLANPQLGNAPSPLEDGNVLPVGSIAALAAGHYRKIPVLAGNTKDEGTLFANLFGSVTGSGIAGFKPNDYDRFGLQFNVDPDATASLTEADLINAAYLPVTATPAGWNALSAFASNSIFLGPVVPQLTSLASQQPTQVWYYRFDWNEEPVPFDTVYGATHALDLPFIFDNFGTSAFSFAFGTANKPGREALSDAMLGSIAAFAKTGNPNHAGLGVTWPNWPAKLVFDASPTQAQVAVQ